MPDIDLTKRSPGSFTPEILSGAPVDFVLDLMYRRVGIPLADPLRSQLVNTHPSDDAVCRRLPDVFPPDDWASRTKSGKLQSVQDWLDLIASVDTTPRGIKSAEPQAAVEPSVIVEAPKEPASSPVVQEDTPAPVVEQQEEHGAGEQGEAPPA